MGDNVELEGQLDHSLDASRQACTWPSKLITIWLHACMLCITQVEPRVAGGNVELEGQLDHSLEPFRQACRSPFLVAGGHNRASAIAAVRSGRAGD